MEFQTNEPIYLQVIHEIKMLMVHGKYSPGDKLPSTRELALEYKINQNTAVRVYQEMERMGYCFTKRGLGTFITEDKTIFDNIGEETAEEITLSFIRGMSALGLGVEEMKSAVERYSQLEK